MHLNLKKLALLTGTCARAFAAKAGLTPQRVDVLLLVRRFHCTHREIALQLCVSRPVISRMLAALRELGLVYEVDDFRDRRRRIPQLTEAGRARLAMCFPSPTIRGAQTTGELEWLASWRSTLARLGVRVDSVARGRLPTFASFEVWKQWRARRATGFV